MANKRLIDANALMDTIEGIDWYHLGRMGYLVRGANSAEHTPLYKADDIYEAIYDATTVEAVEVVHGKWMPQYDSAWIDGQRWKTGYYCSSCMGFNKAESHYCPNCGAKMDGGNEE